MPKSPRAAAASFAALALTLAAAPAAEAAITRTQAQQQVNLSCGGDTCTASFPDLPANQALDLDHVWCELFTTATVWQARIYAAPAAPIFTIPLDPEWVRLVGGSSTVRAYTLGGELNMRVPFGKQLVAVISYEGSNPTGSCSFTGVRLKNG